tara:strand:- start:2339 stop:2707 length:369 start_codon:yes stop_codon:yes gene_type:complete
MFSETETMQTVVLNVLLNNNEVSYEEFKNALIHASLIKPTEESMMNTIRAILISLNRFFLKHHVQLYAGSSYGFKRKYTPTQEAIEFCHMHLIEDMYDEEGQHIGRFFQHPIVLREERLELI